MDRVGTERYCIGTDQDGERLFMAVHEVVLKGSVWHCVLLKGMDDIVPKGGSWYKSIQGGRLP